MKTLPSAHHPKNGWEENAFKKDGWIGMAPPPVAATWPDHPDKYDEKATEYAEKATEYADFLMFDKRIESSSRGNAIIYGKYLKFKPNSIMLDTGVEIKARDVFAQYFAYDAFNEQRSKKNIDITAEVKIIDHREKKRHHLTCILIDDAMSGINLYTKQGYSLWFRKDDRLKKVCDEGE